MIPTLTSCGIRVLYPLVVDAIYCIKTRASFLCYLIIVHEISCLFTHVTLHNRPSGKDGVIPNTSMNILLPLHPLNYLACASFIVVVCIVQGATYITRQVKIASVTIIMKEQYVFVYFVWVGLSSQHMYTSEFYLKTCK